MPTKGSKMTYASSYPPSFMFFSQYVHKRVGGRVMSAFISAAAEEGVIYFHLLRKVVQVVHSRIFNFVCSSVWTLDGLFESL